MSLERTVRGRDTRLAGVVRVACAETVASHLLAPCFATLHAKYPDITAELVPDRQDLSLSMREAEIAVRLTRPIGNEMVIRRVGTLGFGLYATARYLEQHGRLDFRRGCPGHHLIAQFDDPQHVAQAGWLAEIAPGARVALQTNSHEAAISAAVHDAGLACLPRFRADREPGLMRVAVPSAVPSTDIWLAVHGDNRRTARIRAALNHISDSIGALAHKLNPPDAADAPLPAAGRPLPVGEAPIDSHG